MAGNIVILQLKKKADKKKDGSDHKDRVKALERFVKKGSKHNSDHMSDHA